MNRIICIGNRYASDDQAGPKVYDRLAEMELPRGIEVIDGGLGGLDLLRFVEGAERVVFADTVEGFGRPGEVVALDPQKAEFGVSAAYDHSAGLAYLLRVLPEVCDGAVPDVFIVGIEVPPNRQAVAAAAEKCLEIAGGGHGQAGPGEAKCCGEKR
ncbi:MAG: hydrogenase maturation protease [Planctomycetes bacterium]|nr:hydrogenase maturation protease [Planctomycetota bacterium]